MKQARVPKTYIFGGVIALSVLLISLGSLFFEPDYISNSYLWTVYLVVNFPLVILFSLAGAFLFGYLLAARVLLQRGMGMTPAEEAVLEITLGLQKLETMMAGITGELDRLRANQETEAAAHYSPPGSSGEDDEVDLLIVH